MSPRTIALVCVVLLPAKMALCSKGSLTFVLDHTRSMGGEIKAVAEAASAISRKIFNGSESPVENVIVTLFEDPDVHPPLKFTSLDRLLEMLQSSTENLRGDNTCPEMSMTGTRDGLLASNPNSYVYVFTDDMAKDKDLTGEVIDLCQKYGHQIVYIITPRFPHCEKDFRGGVKYYYEVSEFCLGQVFKLLKESELNEVLAYVEETVSSQRTLLTSKVIHNNAFHPEDIPFTLDDEVEYGIVSVSGGSVQLNFTETPSKYASYENITWLQHIKVAKITTPGDYVATVWGGSTVSILVFGQSDFVFEHGFSTFPAETLETTSKQPIADEKNYLMIKLNGVKGDLNMTTAQLLYYNNESNILIEIPLQISDETNKIYTAVNPFYPPKSVFKIAINGYDVKSNKTLRRLSRTTINNQKLPKGGGETKPQIIIEGDSKRYVEYEKFTTLKCIVIANPKPHINWIDKTTGTEKITPVQTIELLYKYVSFLQVENITNNITYECRASNEMGQDNKTFDIEIRRNIFFEIEEVPTDKTIEYKGEGSFVCMVNSLPISNVTWYKNENVITIDENHEISINKSILTIKDMQPELEGNYSCRITNSDRDETFPFSISISKVEKPKIRGGSTNETIKVGEIVVLNCKVDGLPPPQVKWFVDDKEILNGSRYVVDDENTLSFTATVNDSEEFICEAVNYYGKARKVDRIDVYEIPEIDKTETQIQINETQNETITCRVARGFPLPTIEWRFNNKLMDHTGEDITFVNIQRTETGVYKCIATNIYGNDEHDITVTVLYAPIIKGKEIVEIKGRVGKLASIDCNVEGEPTPTIKWFVNGTEIKNSSRYIIHGNQLSIVHVDDNGEYICEAVNIVGKATKRVDLGVYEKPEINKTENTKTYMENTKNVQISCGIIRGKPKPNVTWYLNVQSSLKVIGPIDNETITYKTIGSGRAGTYTCKATNMYGFDTHKIIVQVERPATAKLSVSNFLKISGEQIYLPCIAEGVPPPVVEWYANDTKITSGGEYSIIYNNVRFTTTLNTMGNYKCVSKNKHGGMNASVSVTVYVPVKIISPESKRTKIEIFVNKDAMLTCHAESYPEPKYTWLFLGRSTEPISSHENSTKKGISTLLLNNLQIRHAGIYICNASNDYSFDTLTYEVEALAPAQINKKNVKNTINFIHGDTMAPLACEVLSGYPPPNITWTLFPSDDLIAQVIANEGEPKHTFSKKEEYDINLDGTLFIKKVTTNYDENRYCCRVKNRVTTNDDNNIILYTINVSID